MLRYLNFFSKIFVSVTFWLLFGTTVWAQTDTTFWFVAPEVANSHGDRPVGFRVTSQGQAATVTLSMPSNPNFTPVSWLLPANGTRTVIYNNSDTINLIENNLVNTVHNKGLLITATTPITAYYEVITGGNNPDIFALKGRNALGTDFIVPSQREMENAHGHERIDIVATEDNTTITIVPTANLAGTGAATVNIVLDRGQTYSVRASSTDANVSLRGTRITSNKKVAITITDDSVRGGSIYGAGCFDLLGDQLIPTAIIGQEYIAIRGFLNLNQGIREKVYVVASQDNTIITINGTQVATLNTGQTHEQTFNSNEMFISATAPVYVMHISGFGCETGMAILPPVACTGSEQVGFTRTTNEFFGLYIFAENGIQGGFSLNGNASLLAASEFDTVPFTNGQWVYTRKSFTTTDTLQIGTGNLVTNTLGKFHMGIINGGATSGCRYGFFSDFARYLVNGNTNSSPEDPLCEGDTLRVWADSIVGATQYNWNTPNGLVVGRTIVIPSFTASDTGKYWVTAIVDGCNSENDTVEVSMRPKPGNPNASNTGPYCLGDNIQLTADSLAGVSYNWTGPNNFTSNLRNPIIPAASFADTGLYQLQLTLNGCVGDVHSTQVVVHPIPAIPQASATHAALCPGDTLFLHADTLAGSSYLWEGPDNFTSTLQHPIIPQMSAAKAGIYRVSRTINGCTSGFDSINVSLLPGPLAVSVFSGSLQSCNGDSTVLRISPAFGNSYQWFRNGVAIRPAGVNDTLLVVNSSGNYQLEATSIFGCTDTSNSIFVQFNTPANTSIASSVNPPIVCTGDSIRLQAVAQAGMSYQWLRNGVLLPGATDSFLVVNQAGQYSIQITDSNNCISSSTNSTLVQTTNPPTAQIAQGNLVQFCNQDTVHLQANNDSLAIYQWLRNGQLLAGAQSQTLVVDSSGNYQLVLQYPSGCSDTSQATVVQFFTQPQAQFTLQGDSIRCFGDTIRLAANHLPGYVYQWLRNDTLIAGATDSVLLAHQNGLYRLIVTNSDGCTDSSNAQLLQFSQPIAPTLQGANTRQICQGDTITLSMQVQGSGQLQWLLNGNPIATANDSTLRAHQAGVYRLLLTDSFGCEILSDSIQISFFPAPNLTLSHNNPLSFCHGGQTTLSVPFQAGNSYQWLADGNPIAGTNAASLLVDTTGNYAVIVSTANGCIDTSTSLGVLSFPNPNAQIISVRQISCPGDTIILRAVTRPDFVYQWLRAGIALPGAQADSLVVSLPGQYALVVTDSNNCTGVASNVLIQHHTPASTQVQLNGPATFCLGDSSLLSATSSPGARYQWLNNNVPLVNDTNLNLRVFNSGSYRLVVSSAQGCVDTSVAQNIVVHPTPNAQLQLSGSDSICVGDSALLTALNASGQNISWLRNGQVIPGQNQSNLAVFQNGSYQLVFTNANNCQDTSAVQNIVLRPQPLATLNLSGNIQLCQGEQITLRGPVSSQLNYQWFRNGSLLASATADSLLVNSTGTYTLRVSDVFGCSDTAASVVVQVDTLPNVQLIPSGTVRFCPGASQQLIGQPQAGLSFQWFRNGISIPGATFSTFTATQAGDYQLVVNNPTTGCRDSSAIVVVELFTQPQVSISTVDSTTQCAGEQVNLVATTSAPTLSFQWLRNGSPVAGIFTSNILAGVSGSYQAVVTNNNGCRDTSNAIVVNILSRPSAAIIQSGPFDICEGEPLSIRVPNQAGVQYQWFRNGIDIPGANNFELVVTQSGTYHCVVTHTNGCGAISQDVVVNIRPRPATPLVTPSTPSCFGDDILLEAAQQNGVTYQWRGPNNFSSNQRNPVIANANPTRSGWYYCSITENGCTSLADSTYVLVYPEIPNFSIRGKTRLCTGNTLALSVDSIPGAQYSWLDPSGTTHNGRQFTINESWLSDSGTYSLNLLVNGCVAPPKAVQVTVNDHNFYFPTAFTPNGDGLNELFKPATFYQGPYDLRIYDRWGQLVFQSNDPAVAWDGSVFGGPGEASAYNYVLYYQGCVRQDEFISGTVLLVR